MGGLDLLIRGCSFSLAWAIWEVLLGVLDSLAVWMVRAGG